MHKQYFLKHLFILLLLVYIYILHYIIIRISLKRLFVFSSSIRQKIYYLFEYDDVNFLIWGMPHPTPLLPIVCNLFDDHHWFPEKIVGRKLSLSTRCCLSRLARSFVLALRRVSCFRLCVHHKLCNDQSLSIGIQFLSL